MTDRSLMSCLMLFAFLSGIAIAPTYAQDKKKAGTAKKADGKAMTKTVNGKKVKIVKGKLVKKPPTPIAIDPYKVHLTIAIQDCPQFTTQVRAQIRKEIEQLAHRTWGRMWKLEIVDNNWIYPPRYSAIERLTAEEVEAKFKAKYDKVLVITVDSDMTVGAREWDWRSNLIGDPAKNTAHSVRAIPNLAIKLLAEVFQPVLTLAFADKMSDSVELDLKAGEFPAPDPIATQVSKGDVLMPVVRYFSKKRSTVVQKVQVQTLTYVIVNRVERGRVVGTLISGVPSVFGKKARRAEQMALRRRPRYPTTRIKIVLRDNPAKPLLSHRVEIIKKLRYREKETEPPLKLVSDRYGKVDVPVAEGNPTMWIYAWSGRQLLARVPYAPGLDKVDTILMPDDSMRLAVEGEVDLLTGKLIDVVAQGAVHRSAAKKYATEGKQKEVLKEVEELGKLPGLKDFTQDLITVERTAVQKAIKARNRTAENRIKRVCKAIRGVVKTYFAPEREKQFKEELERLFEDSPDVAEEEGVEN